MKLGVAEGKKCFQPFAKTSPFNFCHLEFHYPDRFPYYWILKLIENFWEN